MGDIAQDLRFAFRTLAKSPGFTLVVALTLALGIGANTAIFSLLDQVLLRLVPVKNPEELVILDAPGPFSGSTHNNSRSLTPISHAMFEALREGNSVFDGVLAHSAAAVHLTSDGETERVAGDLVSGTYFPVLGLAPAAGRLFTPDDDRTPGNHPVVVLSHTFWTQQASTSSTVRSSSRTSSASKLPRSDFEPNSGLSKSPCSQAAGVHRSCGAIRRTPSCF
jgi:hypothetical protein